MNTKDSIYHKNYYAKLKADPVRYKKRLERMRVYMKKSYKKRMKKIKSNPKLYEKYRKQAQKNVKRYLEKLKYNPERLLLYKQKRAEYGLKRSYENRVNNDLKHRKINDFGQTSRYDSTIQARRHKAEEMLEHVPSNVKTIKDLIKYYIYGDNLGK